MIKGCSILDLPTYGEPRLSPVLRVTPWGCLQVCWAGQCPRTALGSLLRRCLGAANSLQPGRGPAAKVEVGELCGSRVCTADRGLCFSNGYSPGSGRSPGEGSGSPLQDSCLENPTDGGAWWAADHEVTTSQTRLSDFTFTFHFHAS